MISIGDGIVGTSAPKVLWVQTTSKVSSKITDRQIVVCPCSLFFACNS